MLNDILQKAIIIIVGGLLAVSAAIIFFRLKNVNRTERAQIFKSAEYFNAGIILICFVVTMVYGIFYHIDLKKSVNAVISLNYSEASQALNSNGTRYNMTEIIGDEVIERAINKGALENVSVKQLKDCLSVYPYVQGGVGDESKYHISTEFAVEYHASKNTSHLDSENVINLVTTAYKEYYIEKYTDNFSLDAQKPDFGKTEYSDAVAYLEKEAGAVLNYLYGMAEKDPSFVTDNGSTFNSIAGKVYNFKEIQINQNLKSFILQNGIARDKVGYIDRLTYQNNDLEYDRKKSEASYEVCRLSIDMYGEEMISVVLVPTWDSSGKYYMGRTKVGVDELSVLAAGYSSDVAAVGKEIMENEAEIDKITSAKQSAKLYESADLLIDSAYNSIKDFEKEAIIAGREYSRYKMNQCVAVTIYGASFMSELKALAVFALFAYAALVLWKISRKFPQKA